MSCLIFNNILIFLFNGLRQFLLLQTFEKEKHNLSQLLLKYEYIDAIRDVIHLLILYFLRGYILIAKRNLFLSVLFSILNYSGLRIMYF